MLNSLVICGRTGSGKTTLSRRIADRLAIPHVEVSELVFEDFRRETQHSVIGDQLFSYVSERLRVREQYTRFARLTLERVRDRASDAPLVIVSGFRTPAELRFFARACDWVRVAFLRCSTEIRRERKPGPLFGLQFATRDDIEEGWGIGWLSLMADMTIDSSRPIVECEDLLAALAAPAISREAQVRRMDFTITIGPKSWDRNELKKLLRHRVRFVRFPFAKETHEKHAENSARVRSVAAELGTDVWLVADLPGGKPRLSNDEPRRVEHGDDLSVRLREGVGADLFVEPPLSNYEPSAGDVIAIGDGELEYVVNRVDQDIVHGEFLRAGLLERRRAFIPRGVDYEFESFTEADKLHAKAAKAAGFDAVAVSFVTSRDDITAVRVWLKERLNWAPRILAKIETTQGVGSAHEIASAVDAVIVGRGDLLLEAPAGELWKLQSTVVRACRRVGTPVMIGTGVLESMIDRTFPSRAEIIDFLAAARMGASGVMFSGETTIGIDPVAVLDTAERLATGDEGYRP